MSPPLSSLGFKVLGSGQKNVGTFVEGGGRGGAHVRFRVPGISVCPWMIDLGLLHLHCAHDCILGHSLLSIDSTIDGILMRLMQVRHRLSVFF